MAEPPRKRVKRQFTPVGPTVTFMGKTFNTGQDINSEDGVSTLNSMLQLLRELEPEPQEFGSHLLPKKDVRCPDVQLELQGEQPEGTVDRGDIWIVQGPLAWLMILAISNVGPETPFQIVLTRFNKIVASGSKLLMHGALFDIFLVSLRKTRRILRPQILPCPACWRITASSTSGPRMALC